MTERLIKIAGQFDLTGNIAEIKPLGEGFINDTYVVTMFSPFARW